MKPEMNITRILNTISQHKWVLGAINLDEDLHFSSFYLRTSVSSYTAPLYPGYSVIIGIYKPFQEEYYLQKEECIHNSDFLIQKALEDYEWWEEILRRIQKLTSTLEGIFPDTCCPRELFASMSTEDLLDLYQRHNEQHLHLYKYARVPEAMDRGINRFTEYLKSYLQAQGVDEENIFATFDSLINLETSRLPSFSVMLQELKELVDLFKSSLSSETLDMFVQSPQRARKLLPAEFIIKMRKFIKKWRFVYYHGYGEKLVLSENILLDKIHALLLYPEFSSMLDAALSKSPANRDRERKSSQINVIPDQKHMRLFHLYTQISLVKAYRRYVQLRNFFYLDALIEEFAIRLGCDEWTVRCMLPEEVRAAMLGQINCESYSKRKDGFVYVLTNTWEHIFTGDQAKKIINAVKANSYNNHRVSTPNVLKGDVVSTGGVNAISGKCKVITRGASLPLGITRDTIIITRDADPDFIDFILQSRGLLTEEGGVTSHLAILCREHKIPAVFGVRGLLKRIHDGDSVVVNLKTGTIQIKSSTLSSVVVFPPFDQIIAEVYGNKAYMLGKAMNVKIPNLVIPPFVVVEYKAVLQYIENRELKRLVDTVLGTLNVQSSERLAVRSSSVQEDLYHRSSAGRYPSFTDVPKGKLYSCIKKFVAEVSGLGYKGGIIIQKMVYPQVAGVCFTKDPTRPSSMVIEFVKGSNYNVTGGRGRVSKLVVDRKTGDIVEGKGSEDYAILPSDIFLSFLQLESVIGYPIDIEWGVVGTSIYIFQIRPITSSA